MDFADKLRAKFTKECVCEEDGWKKRLSKRKRGDKFEKE